MLGGWQKAGRLITIADWKDRNEEEEFQLMFFGVWYPQTFYGFGHPRRKGSYGTFLLTDTRNRTDVWVPNKWTQVCFAYRSRDAFFSITKGRDIPKRRRYKTIKCAANLLLSSFFTFCRMELS